VKNLPVVSSSSPPWMLQENDFQTGQIKAEAELGTVILSLSFAFSSTLSTYLNGFPMTISERVYIVSTLHATF